MYQLIWICLLLLMMIWTIAANECVSSYWDYKAELKANPPLILKNNNKDIILPELIDGSKDREIRVSLSPTEELTITCPGTKLKKTKFGNEVTIQVKCDSNGKLYQMQGNQKVDVDIKDTGCKTRIKETVRKVKHTNGQIFICDYGNKFYGVVYKIGFVVANDFYTVVGVCYNWYKSTTIWTRHTIHGKNLAAHAKRNVGRNFQIVPPMDKNVMDNNIYPRKEQHEWIGRLIDDEEFISYERRYLEKGHLAPVADFVSRAEMIATNNYINVVPQWHDINQGNWLLVEKEVREFAEKKKKDVTVVSGGYGIMTRGPHEIFIRALPVPKYLWKFVELNNEAVVFVVLNNPYHPEDNPLCEDMCNHIGFLNDGSRLKRFNHYLRKNWCFGDTICCQVNDELRVKIPTIPGTDSMNLLDGINIIDVEE